MVNKKYFFHNLLFVHMKMEGKMVGLAACVHKGVWVCL